MNHKHTRILGKSFLTVAMAAVLFLSVGTTALAETVQIKSDGTNCRAEASVDSQKVLTANKGQAYNVEDTVTGADGKTWYKITTASGSAFVRSDLVVSSETPTQAEAPTEVTVTGMASTGATVTGDAVNVRKSASASAELVATVKKGTAVTVNGSATGADGKTWYQVSFINNGNDVSGFVRSDFLEMTQAEETPVAEEPVAEVNPEDEAALADIYGDIPTQQEAEYGGDIPYELVYTADQEGVDTWYLYDYNENSRYKLEQLLAATIENHENEDVLSESAKKMRTGMIIAFALLAVALIVIGLLIIKLRDVLEDDDEDEEEERRRRAAAQRRAQANASQSRPAQGQPRQGQRPASQGQPRQGQRPAVQGQSRQGQRPAGQRPAQQAQKKATPQPETVKKPTPDSETGWKSKNFFDQDDELDYSFIDMDDDE